MTPVPLQGQGQHWRRPPPPPPPPSLPRPSDSPNTAWPQGRGRAPSPEGRWRHDPTRSGGDGAAVSAAGHVRWLGAIAVRARWLAAHGAARARALSDRILPIRPPTQTRRRPRWKREREMAGGGEGERQAAMWSSGVGKARSTVGAAGPRAGEGGGREDEVARGAQRGSVGGGDASAPGVSLG